MKATLSFLSKRRQLQRLTFDELSKKLNIRTQHDWYKVSCKDAKSAGSDTLLLNFRGSLCYALQSVYPEFVWHPWLFKKLPKDYWMIADNRFEYFEWLSEQLEISHPNDWSRVTLQQIRDNGGAGLLSLFDGSLRDALSDVYPEHEALHVDNRNHSQHVWNSFKSKRERMDWLAEQLNVQKQNDWYLVTSSLLKNIGAQGALSFTNGSLYAALKMSYPEYDWYPWMFEKVPQNFWDEEINRKGFVDWLGETLGIEESEEWYGLTAETVSAHGGRSLIDLYGGSAVRMLQSVYPQYDWHFWMFEKAPQHFWNSPSNQKNFLDWTTNELVSSGTKRITAEKLRKFGGNSLISAYNGSFTKALSSLYNDSDSTSKFASSVSDAQSYFFRKLLLLTKEPLLLNYKHPTLFHSISKKNIELDIYIPSLRVAFEFQGGHHYSEAHKGSLSEQRNRDEEKRRLCQQENISLIQIPYWWNCSTSSLMSTLRQHKVHLGAS